MSRYSYSRHDQLPHLRLFNQEYADRKSMLCQEMIAGIGKTSQRHSHLICGHARTSVRISLSLSRRSRKPSGRHFSSQGNYQKKERRLNPRHLLLVSVCMDASISMRGPSFICMSNLAFLPRFQMRSGAVASAGCANQTTSFMYYDCSVASHQPSSKESNKHGKIVKSKRNRNSRNSPKSEHPE